MEGQSCIFWFSGTGNSLYAAKRLAKGLNDLPLMRMAGGAATGAVGGEGAAIGFVFPSYYGNLPRAVRAFVESLEIRPGTYLFCAVTMGGAGQGSVSALKAALRDKGLTLDYGRGVKMPANYVLKYNPADPAKAGAALQKADARLDRMAADIAARTRAVRAFPLTARNLYRNIEALDSGFFATDKCNGCGLCARVCPVENIGLENGKPVWRHHCEHCVACISLCPVRAIEFGQITQGRRRYRNPSVSAVELSRE